MVSESGKVDLVKIAELLRIVARHCEEGNAELLRVIDELEDARARIDELEKGIDDVHDCIIDADSTLREMR